MAGGHFHSLVHPSEIVTIGGAALGALIVMSPKKVLIDLIHGIIHAIKGSPFNKRAYLELFSVTYDLFRIGRRDGMLAWDSHLSAPQESLLLQKYPFIHGNHHVRDFLCGALQMISDGRATPAQVETLLKREIQVMEDEHHAASGALSKTADALPGFGIVAAVLGIVVTMGAISGPVEEIGHKVGAALVGTFLGILLSYGFFGPLAGRMDHLGKQESAYFYVIVGMIADFLAGGAPKGVVELARRGVGTEHRPTLEELTELFKTVESNG
jgi:chemotaxis protein MotA